MADKDYITAHDVTMAEQARLALMEFERKAGSVYPTHTVSVDSPVAFQQVCKALGMKPHPVESTKGAFSHWVVESASGVQFWHTAPKEAR